MNKDQVKGRVEEAKGAVKENTGKVVGNPRSRSRRRGRQGRRQRCRRTTATPRRRSRTPSTRSDDGARVGPAVETSAARQRGSTGSPVLPLSFARSLSARRHAPARPGRPGRRRRCRGRLRRAEAPAPRLDETIADRLRQEAADRRVHVSVAVAPPAGSRRSAAARAGAGDAARASSPRRAGAAPPRSRRRCRWPCPTGMQPSTTLQHRDRAPLLPLGRMDRREDQVVLVEAAGPGFVAGGRRRVERQLGEEALARRRSRPPGAPGERCRRRAARRRRAGARAAAGTSARPRRCRPATATPGARSAANRRRELRPRRRRRGRRREPDAAPPPDRRPRPSAAITRVGARRADARHELQRPPGGALAARVGGEAQHREHVLDVRRLEELQAAVLDEGDVAPRQLELERGAVLGRAEQHRLALQHEPGLAQREGPVGDPGGLLALARRPRRSPAARPPAGRSTGSLAWRSAARAMTAFEAASSGAVER